MSASGTITRRAFAGGALALHLACMNQSANHSWPPTLEARLCQQRCEKLARELVELIAESELGMELAEVEAAIEDLERGGLIRHLSTT